jgi:hypothetical protein
MTSMQSLKYIYRDSIDAYIIHKITANDGEQ